jgi:branched-chain amino acid transport system permease protein
MLFRRLLIWGLTAAVMILVPLLFKQSFALSMLSQMGIAIIFALSYNMLLGQAGMLSFGHAVYYGLGAFVCAHTLNAIGAGKLTLPVMLLPLVGGGLHGLAFGIVFGYVTTKRSGTPFAMISLGIAEMVAACALMFPGFFGGEGGIATNRQVGQAWHGLSFGPQIQVYYLIAGWCFLCMIVMFAFTQTPLGRMANAVRDNPERVKFVGYNATRVRYPFASPPSSASPAAGTINYEIVTAERRCDRLGQRADHVVRRRSGAFLRPVIGAMLVLPAIRAVQLYAAWLLYFGLFFAVMILLGRWHRQPDHVAPTSGGGLLPRRSPVT